MKIRLLVLLFLLFSRLLASAQFSPAQVDSLKKQTKLYVNKDSVRVNLLIALADAITNTDPNEAMNYTDEAVELAQELKSPLLIAVTYRQKGIIYYVLNDYSNAVEYDYKALKASDRMIKDKKGTKLLIATVYNNLGAVFLEMADYDKAIANFTNFLNVTRQLNEPNLRREESIALLNIGETYIRKKNNQSAIDYANQSLKIAEADKDYQIAAYNLCNRAIAYGSLKQYQLSIESFQKSIVDANKVNDFKIKAQALAGLAEVLYDLRQVDKSEIYAKQAYQLTKELKLLQLQRESSQLLTYIYIIQKNSTLAEQFLDITLALRDSILNDDKKQEIARKEERFEREKREAVLTAQHTAELKQQQTKRNAIAGGTGILVLASGISFLFYKRKRDSDEQVKVERFSTLISDTELKVLRSQIDPHFIFNALNSISYYVLNNDPFTADRYLTKFATLMRSILNNSDRTEVPLAEDMEALDLYMQLESLRLDHRFTYTFDIDPSLDQQRTLIPPLLLQPFVENSIWHGLATKESDGKITIGVRKAGDMLVCTVTDNGIGRARAVQVRQAQPERKSRGMNITQARIEIINRLKKSNGYMILSDLAEGTEVAVTLPLAIV